ncbi:hypothetical protein WKK05_26150 [Nostoc sp. UHCC 0302]|uniref:hypothetical protein n=1 Tax=Nostoc sp. UHCC 0302 TaxID=3134896 RepID=UPI00311CC73B
MSYKLNYIQALSVNSWQDTIEETFLENLKKVDFQAIFLRLTKSHKGKYLSVEEALFSLQKYGLFLFLIQKYQFKRMVPNQEIDAVLHAHLSNGHQFERECQHLFSASLKHLPEFGVRGEDERLEWQSAFAKTQELFELNYGEGTMGCSAAACCEILLSF